MFAARKVDLRLVIFFLLWTLHNKTEKNQAISKARLFEAFRILLVVLRAYFPKDSSMFTVSSRYARETFDEVILEASFREILRISTSRAEFLFLTDHAKKLQEGCQGTSHNDHWALQTCCEIVVAAYRNGITTEDLFSAAK